jgi:hypothetical protein
MQSIYYSTVRLVLSLVGGVAMIVFGLMMLGAGHGKVAFAGGLFVLLGPPLALGSLKILLSDRVALRFDNKRLAVATMWRKRELLWSDVASIGVSSVSTYAAYGLIKTGSSSSLEIATNGGLFGTKKLSLSKGLLKLDPAGLLGLVVQLERARAGAPVTASVVPASALARTTPSLDPLEGLPRDAGFDADVALARYMAQRDHKAEPASHVPARPAFGRRAA